MRDSTLLLERHRDQEHEAGRSRRSGTTERLIPDPSISLEDLERALHCDLANLDVARLMAERILVRLEWARRMFRRPTRDEAISLGGQEWVSGSVWLRDRLDRLEGELRRRPAR